MKLAELAPISPVQVNHQSSNASVDSLRAAIKLHDPQTSEVSSRNKEMPAIRVAFGYRMPVFISYLNQLE